MMVSGNILMFMRIILSYQFNLTFLVDAGTKAVVFDKFQGIQQKTVGEGTHFKIPFIQVPIIMDVRSRPRTIHSVTGTKDLQMVRYHINFF
jgi:regulator of protease activity HflC (stomatin/prohibitin superfamily)